MSGDRGELLAELLGHGWRARFRARGSSMRPSLCDGDVVTLGPLHGPPGPGTVVVARRGTLLLVHRVAAVERGALLLRGDACSQHDGLFAPEELLGAVVAVERDGRALGAYRLGGMPGRVLGWLVPLTRLWLRASDLVARRLFAGRSSTNA